MKITEIVDAYGHENIRATHKTTFEITKESTLTKRGDCVIAVGATKGSKDLSSEFKEAMKRQDAQITITVEASEIREVVKARGSPQLLFTHPTDMVVRKSNYICGRTIAIKANKAARDISRKLVEKIRTPDQKIKITLTVESY
ncbi:MAG: DUF371 domain-containing protein [Candidatus Bathyarchaeota archaeon]|nr:DUF371 domain-containing protein [Candidatus Bathyarchaeota archaeon]MDH5595553.1 DUF371 domain-containing protein [Candidatus Bathyarchaeota archaeon]